MAGKTGLSRALVSLALLPSIRQVVLASGSTELNHNYSHAHALNMLRNRGIWHERRDEFFDYAVFATYPTCSMNCLEDSVRDTTCASLNDTPKLYSDCVCRRSDAFQLAAAVCIAKQCSSELRSSARKFSDNCASSGGSTVPYETWLNPPNGTAQTSTPPAASASGTVITPSPSTTPSSPRDPASSDANNKLIASVTIIAALFTIAGTFFGWRMWLIARAQRESPSEQSSGSTESSRAAVRFLRPVDNAASRLLAVLQHLRRR